MASIFYTCLLGERYGYLASQRIIHSYIEEFCGDECYWVATSTSPKMFMSGRTPSIYHHDVNVCHSVVRDDNDSDAVNNMVTSTPYSNIWALERM